MAMASNRERPELQRNRKEKENTLNPERAKVCSEALNKLKPDNSSYTQKRFTVPVIYYLSQNGQLQHPHFMEVPLSSPPGLFLRDVISRLSLLRGKAMASQYSWSSKRSYKNGYVWHDLEENDFIYPVHGGEYVLKGSEILETVSKFPETSSPDFPPAGRNRRRNQSWGAIDLHEYKVYKAESTRESDASTQTDDKRRRGIRAAIKEEEIEEMGDGTLKEERDKVEQSAELSGEEISPPPCDSSPETLESLIKADGRLILAASSSSSTTTSLSKASMQAVDQDDHQSRAGNCPSGKMKAPSVIMSLISCGSLSFRDCGVAAAKDHGMSYLISNHKTRLPRGEKQAVEDHDAGDDDVIGEIEKSARSKFAKMAMEDKEYFSGSLLMETNTNKDDFPALKLQRSSSYNSDRSSHLKMAGKEEEVIARCMPRRPKKTQETGTHKKYQVEITNVAINKSTQAGN